MPKIIQIENDIVSIGMDDNSIKDVPISACNFTPKIGDAVDIFQSEEKIIITKVEVPVWPEAEPVPVGKRRVNKIAYAMFAIFLGGLGVHKFYAGKIIHGVLYLLFCWCFIPSLIGFIEGIIALTKTPDAYGNIIV